MHGETLLRDLVVLVAVAIPIVLVARRLRVPSIAGFLLAGVAIGPHALGLIGDPEAVQRLADVGVVLLLFAVGLELSVSRILGLGRAMLQAGGFQVAGTIAAVAAVCLLAGMSGGRAACAGILVAVSSTTIVLKTLAAREELDAPHGRVVVAVRVFQDLAVVPLMLAIPMLAGTAGSPRAATLEVTLSLLAVGAAVVVGRFVVPRLLELILREQNRELFTLAIVIVGLGAAYLMSLFGVSLALGAFLAGLVVSESEYGLQALSDVLPFRDVFAGLFFASVGMLLDPAAVSAAPGLTFGLALGTIALKAVVTGLAVASLGAGLQTSVLSGLALAQIGEFSFVLAGAALPLGLVTGEGYQLFLAVTVLSMLLAPFLITQAPVVAEAIARFTGHVPLTLPTGEQVRVNELRDHVIVVGYGLNGRNLARVLRGAGIAYVVLEQNAQAVRRGRSEGEPIYFGDGTNAEVLERVGLRRARVLVLAIAAVHDERRGTAVARRLNPAVHILVRTRYMREVEELQRLGANEVVPEEFETSLEIFARVLRRYGLPSSAIRREVEEARGQHYEKLRDPARPDAGHLAELAATLGVGLDVETVEVGPGSPAAGGDPRTLRIRSRTGVNVVAAMRGREVIYEASPGFRFEAGDAVVLVGPPDAMPRARELFRAPDGV